MTPGVVRTRFAPSPTGELHLGSARTALFNWLFARRMGGAFVVRVEDTDPERSSPRFEASILRDLEWLGLRWDEGPDKGGDFGPYRQSERVSGYAREAKRLLDAGSAYRCFCTRERLEELTREQMAKGIAPRYDGRCRGLAGAGGVEVGSDHVIRFRVPDDGRTVTFTDGVHGPVEVSPSDLGDFIIVASDGVATYNFASVVDDATMEISHVIRGDDHLPNTPRQVLLYRALGFEVPAFFHVPLVLGPDRTPLGKRHGTFTLAGLRAEGYLPLAVVNAIARLGWAPPEGFWGLDDLAGAFETERLSKSASVFDPARLRAYNKDAIAAADPWELVTVLSDSVKGSADPERLERVVRAVRNNASTTRELEELISPFTIEPHLTETARAELTRPAAQKVLKALREETEKVMEFEGSVAEDVLGRVKEKAGVPAREVLMPIRLALTGASRGIGITDVLDLLGKAVVEKRLARTIERG